MLQNVYLDLHLWQKHIVSLLTFLQQQGFTQWWLMFSLCLLQSRNCLTEQWSFLWQNIYHEVLLFVFFNIFFVYIYIQNNWILCLLSLHLFVPIPLFLPSPKPIRPFSLSDAFRFFHQSYSPAAAPSPAGSSPSPWRPCPARGACSRGWPRPRGPCSCCHSCSWRGPGWEWPDHPDCLRKAHAPTTKLHQPTAATTHGDHWPKSVHLHVATVQWVQLIVSLCLIVSLILGRKRLKPISMYQLSLDVT